MADTACDTTTLALNAKTDDPGGTAIVHANTHVLTPTKPSSKVIVRLENTFDGNKVFTILAGDNPPAHSAGQGNLALTLAKDDVTFVVLESARFLQDNGTYRINVAANTTGFIDAIELP
jgi:hypothetical protein